jgi:hypothetical protein
MQWAQPTMAALCGHDSSKTRCDGRGAADQVTPMEHVDRSGRLARSQLCPGLGLGYGQYGRSAVRPSPKMVPVAEASASPGPADPLVWNEMGRDGTPWLQGRGPSHPRSSAVARIP